MAVTFRFRLLLQVITAGLSLPLVIGIDAWTASTATLQLDRIEATYLPLLQLGPELRHQLEAMQRAFQDASAAVDEDLLENATLAHDRLIKGIRKGRGPLPAHEIPALEIRVDTYYQTAMAVTKRLIAGETGEDMVAAMGEMQAAQRQAVESLTRVTTFDHDALSESFADLREARSRGTISRLAIVVTCLLVMLWLTTRLRRDTMHSLEALSEGLSRFARNDFSEHIRVNLQDEIGDVAQRANLMAESLDTLSREREQRTWVSSGQAGLWQQLQGELEPIEVAQRIVHFLAEKLRAPVGAFYALEQGGELVLQASHGLSLGERRSERIALGDGLVGMVSETQQPLLLDQLPDSFFRIRAASGEALPTALWVIPFVHFGRVIAVLELGLLRTPNEAERELLSSLPSSVGVVVHACGTRKANVELLHELQQQASRLTAQEEELRQINEELNLQQEELRTTNSELVRQTHELSARNVEVESARSRLEEQAAQLQSLSRYKSEFLANMSHELRTPLNSMLLLSEMLARNETGNLEEKQVEFVSTIHAAGQDLLRLINQILDLAKIESGKLSVSPEALSLREMADHLRRVYTPLAANKSLTFSTEIAAGVPERIFSDRTRIEQILTNLVSNAIKFTDRGGVSLRIARPTPEQATLASVPAERTVLITVQDTGIGIAPEDQERVFEAFEQVDSGSQRRHGGTGLGLAIARRLSLLLRGQLRLRSRPGAGTTFELQLPDTLPTAVSPEPSPAPPRSVRPALARERSVPAAALTKGSVPRAEGLRWPAREVGVLLIIEDDLAFAERVSELGNEQGLRVVLAKDGTAGLRLARTHRPTGIVLDLRLPDLDGMTVLDRLRADPLTQDIPVHIISAADDDGRASAHGAVGYLRKPTTRNELLRVIQSLTPSSKARRVLIVEDDPSLRGSIAELLTGQGIEPLCATNGADALAIMKKEQLACVVLDLGLPDIDGLDILKRVDESESLPKVPVIVHTGRALTKAETERIETYTESIVLKGKGSLERVLEELRLFVGEIERCSRMRGQPVPLAASRLKGKRVLVADDDMRTAYAISALLRSRGVEVLVADTGTMAVSTLQQAPNIDAVIMDIMMPEMDGYEAMRQIRRDPRFAELPIIALTAKAMKHDRVCCIEAGASDYMPKPVDGERLLSLLHAWLSTTEESDGNRMHP